MPVLKGTAHFAFPVGACGSIDILPYTRNPHQNKSLYSWPGRNGAYRRCHVIFTGLAGGIWALSLRGRRVPRDKRWQAVSIRSGIEVMSRSGGLHGLGASPGHKSKCKRQDWGSHPGSRGFGCFDVCFLIFVFSGMMGENRICFFGVWIGEGGGWNASGKSKCKE